MKNTILTLSLVLGLLLTSNVNAQQLEKSSYHSISIKDLPEYIIITSENTKLFGGVNINIDSKKSEFEEQLFELESFLQNKDKMRIRNQTDLLNAMLKLGYEYINAYNASFAGATANNDNFGVNQSKSRVNMVFRKKVEFRN